MKNITKILLASTVLLAFGASSASAADFEPPAPTVYDWSGPYFGLKFGGAVDGNADTFIGGAITGSTDLDGVLGGTLGGYNFQHGNFVFGIDTDFSVTDIDGTTGAGAGVAGGPVTVDIDTLSTTRGRIGYALDRVLPFVTGGAAYGSIDIIDPAFAGDADEFAFGFTVGGGVEWAFTDGWHARIEYNFIDLGTETSFGGALTTDIDEIHLVRAGVSLKTGFIWESVFRTLRGE